MDLPLFEDPAITTQKVDFTPTRRAGCDRLKAFMPSAGKAYASSRNYDFGPDNRSNISVLSPWIRHRLLLEEEVLRETLKRHSFAAAEKFVQEVYWRTYFKGWLEQHPSVWTAYKANLTDTFSALGENIGLRKAFDEAVEGRTGIDCFDAWALELVETGYLHNHARMWFASIWIFTLKLPWVLGADFFYRHLMDGDPASNTLSWRWVGGLHTVGKTYLARPDNIRKYTDDKFSPTGLATEAPALLEGARPAKRELADFAHQISPAFLAGAKVGLLITEDDCSPEKLDLSGAHVAGVFALATAAERSPADTGSVANAFHHGAITDAAARAEVHFDTNAIMADSKKDSEEAFSDWINDHQYDAIVYARCPVGPSAGVVKKCARLAQAAGVEMTPVIRTYDAGAWPHAGKGFFGLKKQIPKLIKSITT